MCIRDSPYLIDLEMLVDEGLLRREEVDGVSWRCV